MNHRQHPAQRAIILLAIGGLMLLAQLCAAQATPQEQLQFTTERLVVFKDGYGLVIKKGTATADADGRVYTTDVPDSAVLGCFWATSDDKKMLAMRAEWDEKSQTRKTETACLTVADLLRANVSKTLTLQLTDKTDKGTSLSETGRLVELLDQPTEPLPTGRARTDAAALAAVATASSSPFTTLIRDGTITYGFFETTSIAAIGGTLIRDLTPRGGEFVRLDRVDGGIILPVSHVQAVLGKDLVATIARQQEIYTRSKRLTFDMGKDSAGKPVAMRLFYFTPGLCWIPTYRVSGDLKDKADIALQGEILNDVTDVEHAALDLVVGVPNFRFKDTPSPLALESAMRTALANIADNNGMIRNNSYLQSQFGSNADVYPAARGGGAGALAADLALAPELAGANDQQDLFVYSIPDFSLKKGARATLPLWQQTSALRHLYTYDMRARRSRTGASLAQDQSPDPRSPMRIQMNQVWHQLELTNAGKFPWTTGAALMLQNFLPLGQDLLTYTPAGSKALLPVTLAVDLRGSCDEQETGRVANALHVEAYDYVQITKKGTITLTNFRKEKSDMRITLSTGGKVSAASDNGIIKLNDFRQEDWEDNSLMRVNNHSDVSWELSLDPAQTRTLTYEVTFYVR